MIDLRSIGRPRTCLLGRVVAWAGDRSGTVTITVALTLSALVGFAALATEVGGWYVTKRTMQGAADSSAYSAAMAKAAGALAG